MWLFALACRSDELPPDEGTGLLGTGWANPFPSTHQLSGGHLALRDLPSVGQTPLPVDQLEWRTGFSAAQVSVLRVDGIDPSGFPTVEEPLSGTIRLFDRTAGRELPCLAELDAFPEADERATLIRPLTALTVGHDIAVVVLTGALPRPERFEWLLSDTPPASLADVAPEYRALIDELVPFVPPDEVALAWSFPVGDGATPLTQAIATLETPGSYSISTVRESGLPPFTYRAGQGTFTVQNLLADGALVLDEAGVAAAFGTDEADLYVHVPLSVADAAEGTVPVMVFGHGIFGDPESYLDDPLDPSGLLELADEGGFIVVATSWRGLSSSDLPLALNAATDFGRFPELTSHLVQAQVNVHTLVRLLHEGSLLADPVFTGASGQSLPDPDHLLYYGISLGAIEGMVLAAHAPPIERMAFHVGGSSWSTMLERSSNWTAFDLLLPSQIPNAADRQVLFATTQLWWDPVDPLTYAPALAERDLLLQESIGDEQVPNLTTHALARGAELPVLAPVDALPFGLDTADSGTGRALVRFDPQLPLPPPENRPAPVTGAHEAPRKWPGARDQVIGYLRGEGVVHGCGDAMCSATNSGAQ